MAIWPQSAMHILTVFRGSEVPGGSESSFPRTCI